DLALGLDILASRILLKTDPIGVPRHLVGVAVLHDLAAAAIAQAIDPVERLAPSRPADEAHLILDHAHNGRIALRTLAILHRWHTGLIRHARRDILELLLQYLGRQRGLLAHRRRGLYRRRSQQREARRHPERSAQRYAPSDVPRARRRSATQPDTPAPPLRPAHDSIS